MSEDRSAAGELRPPGQRMAWLDALRAIAALLVVYAHITRYLFGGARDLTSDWLHAGPAGVMLFFLVSGYIIPASLERRGSLRAFWVSRAFRLYPLYLVVGVAVVLLHLVRLVPVDAFIEQEPVTSLVGHLTMLPHLLGVPPVTTVMWTLTFEMAFYLLVSALFAVRLQRAGWVVALGLSAVAVGTAPLTPQQLPVVLTVGVVIVAVGAGLAGLVSGRRWAVVAGGVLVGVTAATLLALDQDKSHTWDGLLIIAVMFVGTTIYRAEHGQTSWWLAGAVIAVVAAALLANWFGELGSLGAQTPKYEARSVITLVVFGGTFAVGMLARRARIPRWLTWIGVISYSVYLVHYVLIELFAPLLTRAGERLPAIGELAVLVAYLGLVVGLSWLTHRYVERPGQRLGRRLAARWGSDLAPPGEVPAKPLATSTR